MSIMKQTLPLLKPRFFNMKKKFFAAILKRNSVQKRVFFSFYLLILFSCANQQQYLEQPVSGYFDDVVHDISPLIGDITETSVGAGNENIPEWLITFFTGGIDEVEKMGNFINKYCFIISIEGTNYGALSKWAANFSVTHDFPRQAAARIEKKLISAATAYPDDEYGTFYESMVKKSFTSEYPGAFLEDTFWIKRIVSQNENGTDSENEEAYEFFVFISIEKSIMQTIIENMMSEVLAKVTPTRAENNAIRHLRQIFFVGF